MNHKTINGILCRMVEPEPLTDDVKFPVAVEIFGKQHILKDKYQGFIPIVFAATYMDMSLHQAPFLCYLAAKIIGYPVVDGSAEWALYHVLHKERYALTGYVNDVLVHIQNTEYGIGLYYSGKIMPFDFITPEQFIKGAAHAGWQLYEPQPEPAPFAVGDWVEYKMDSQVYCGRIEDIRGKAHYLDFTTEIISPDEARAIYANNITRKLDPSEVKIKITLEGTVSICGGNLEHYFFIHTPNTDLPLVFDDIDPDTAKTIRELIKAQEEK